MREPDQTENSSAPALMKIWASKTPDEACEVFDTLNLNIKDVRDRVNDLAADTYHTWILKRLL